MTIFLTGLGVSGTQVGLFLIEQDNLGAGSLQTTFGDQQRESLADSLLGTAV